jgi:aminopeptidase N
MKKFCVFVAVLCLSALALAQRLPQTAAPERYSLKLTPDLDAARFAGEETIAVQVKSPTRAITLNAVNLTIGEVAITAAGKTQKAAVAADAAQEMATLTVAEPIPAGPAEIHISYTGVLNDKLRGFYLARSGERRYAVTQFEPTDARQAFPSFDEPAYKAVFDLTVVAPAQDVVISNTLPVSDTPGPAGRHTVHFAPTPRISSYLVAILVGEFECIAGGADGVPIRVCAPPGRPEMGRFGLQAAESAMRFYNRYFSIKYPYGKLDLIAIPDFEAGAMENVGAITFRDIALLLDEKTASVPMQKEVALVIAHEMAHQWFGDLVTTAWWDDIWLNEGFATWMESKPVAAWKPEWHLEMDEESSADYAKSSDALLATRPIHQSAETTPQINALFDAIAYNKAAAVVRMIESYVGPEVFRQGVNAYIEAHANGNATAPDFWNAIAQVSAKPVDRIMSSFVSQPGVPIVAADFRCPAGAGSLVLRQQRFFVVPPAAAPPQLWTIPVCFDAAAAPGARPGTQCVLLEKPEQSFPLGSCLATANLNAAGAGYYRTSLAPAAARALAAEMSHLTAVERLSLLTNEWALVRSGAHPLGSFLDVASGLRAERNASILRDLGQDLAFLTDYVVTDRDRAAYRQWVRGLLAPAMVELGYAAQPGDSAERRELRSTIFFILGYDGADPEALAQARKLLDNYLRDPATVDPTLLGTVFHLAARQGDAALYDRLRRGLAAAQTPESYYRFQMALTEFSDPALLTRTLDAALAGKTRTQDLPRLIAGVMRNPAGRELAWRFLREHWTEIAGHVSPFATTIFVQSTGAFCDAGSARQVTGFFAAHPVNGAERSLRQALERIGSCSTTRQRQQPELAEWLTTHATR